jgi:hypothetical protein
MHSFMGDPPRNPLAPVRFLPLLREAAPLGAGGGAD